MIGGISGSSGYGAYRSTLANLSSTARTAANTGNPSASGSGGGKIQEKLFALLDSNSDGSVAKDELSSAIDAAQKSDSSLSVDIDDLFSQLDANQDGSLDTAETAALAPPPTPPRNAGQADQDLFSALDADGSGGIGQDELSSALGVASDDSDAASLFAALDTDGDGSLSQAESTALNAPPPPPPARDASANGLDSDGLSQLFSALDSDGSGGVSQDELGSLFGGNGSGSDASAGTDKSSGASQEGSAYAKLLANLVKHYQSDIDTSISLGSQLNLSA